MVVASGPVYRSTIALAVAYWEGACTLPWHDETTIASLCRMPIAHIRPIKSDIIHALSQITPEMDKVRQARLKTYEARHGQALHARSVLLRLRQRQDRPSGTAPALLHEATANQGPSKREQARKGNAGSPRTLSSPRATFTDGPRKADG
jgi:hypothetical protein